MKQVLQIPVRVRQLKTVQGLFVSIDIGLVQCAAFAV